MKKQLLTFLMTTAAAVLVCTGCTGQTPAKEDTPNGIQEETGSADQSAQDTTNAEQDKAQDKAEAADDSAKASAPEEAPLTDGSLGPVSLLPNAENGYSMVYGDAMLHAYFKRENVLPGTGRLTVKKSSDDSVVETIDLKKAGACLTGKADSTFSLLGWKGGTHLMIPLGSLPKQGEAYYITMEQGAFTSSDGTILSKEITDQSTWQFGVAKYGILPATPNGSDVFVGDVLSADIFIQPPAACAKIENYDENRVRFNEKEFEADGKLDIKIYQLGEDSFTVTFYDKEDNPLSSITLSYTASMPPEPVEELPKKPVTNL